MLRISVTQQKYEIRQLVEYLRPMNDLDIVELQVQQIKRLTFWAKKGLGVFNENDDDNIEVQE